jgi:hypothetical protein
VATDLENLNTTRSAILAELALITTDRLSYSVDGQSGESKRMQLLRQLAEINKLIEATQGPYEVVSEGY